jgi:hypothetical protein
MRPPSLEKKARQKSNNTNDAGLLSKLLDDAFATLLDGDPIPFARFGLSIDLDRVATLPSDKNRLGIF